METPILYGKKMNSSKTVPKFIQNAEKIKTIFGYFPTFHDDEIVSFSQENDSVFLKIKSEAIKQKIIFVTFELKKVSKSFFYDIKKCPLVYLINFKKITDKKIEVELEPVYWENPEDDISWICEEVVCSEVLVSDK